MSERQAGLTDSVIAQRHGAAGLITVNRPAALNALDLGMVRAMAAMLHEWADDDRVKWVIVRGAPRANGAPTFCAGGDIRFFHRAALAGDPRLEDFFTEEYSLNHLIHSYPKPYVAMMDGIVMGGGMGISQGASWRVVTERSSLAMPETQIGLFPDVGGGWFLSRCPGSMGEYLALTGAPLGPGDAIASGLADIQVPSQTLPRLTDSLTSTSDVGEVLPILTRASVRTVSGELAAAQHVIERHFAHACVRDIEASLAADDHPLARRALHDMGLRSPLMMAVALEQVRRARKLPLAECLRMERNLVRNCFHVRPGAAGETVEGIRALAVDKDRQPRWVPAQSRDVTASMIERYFAEPWPSHAHPLRHLVDVPVEGSRSTKPQLATRRS